MVATYTIAGQKIGSHVLAMATLGTFFGGSWLATRGGSKEKATKTPPINASSKEEENYIQEFLQQIEQEDKAAKIQGKQPH